MSDDSSTLTGESLEAVTPTITPRYYLGNNSTLSPALIYHGLMENSYFDLISFLLLGGWACNVVLRIPRKLH